jgi:DNA-binding response OmpR family regulator
VSRAVRILLVEDDLDIANALTPALRRQGLVVTHVRTAADALTADPGDLVLLDLGLPDGDGIDVCRKLRNRSQVPVIAVTARGLAADRVRGLRSGADDYVVKPFSIAELLARIDAVLRRTGLLQARPTINVEDLSIDIESRTVTVADEPVDLTRKEFDILAVLALNHGRVVAREQVALYAWQSVFEASSRTMDVHIASLRHKLGRPDLVQTIRGVGYRLGTAE